MNVVVTGSRDWPEAEQQPIVGLLDGLYQQATMGHLTVEVAEFHLYVGDADGVDGVARWWAKDAPTHSHNEGPDDPLFGYHVFHAKWGLYGKAAGPVRNAQMLDAAEPGLLLAFHSSLLAFQNERSGTNHCARLGEQMGFTVYDIIRNPR